MARADRVHLEPDKVVDVPEGSPVESPPTPLRLVVDMGDVPGPRAAVDDGDGPPRISAQLARWRKNRDADRAIDRAARANGWPTSNGHAVMPCLRCRRRFVSDGKSNRLCEACRSSNAELGPLAEGSPFTWED